MNRPHSFHFCTLLLYFFFLTKSHAQKALDWQTLAKVTFEIEYDDEDLTYYMVPEFSDTVMSYQNEMVTIEGYFIPLETEDNIHVLSRYPYSSCFFCGAAGPESVIELQMKEPVLAFMDQRIRVQGLLELNAEDLNHFNYIVKDAVFLND